MLKQEYAQHIAEMSQRVRAKNGRSLKKTKKIFSRQGTRGPFLAGASDGAGRGNVSLYRKSGMAGTGKRMPGNIFSVQDELVQRYEDGSLPFIYKQEDGKPIEGPSKNPLEVLEEMIRTLAFPGGGNDFLIYSGAARAVHHRPRRIHAGGMEQAGDLVLCGDQPHLPRLRMGTAQPRHIAGHRVAAVCKAVPAKRVRRALSEAGGYAV